jgi:hypothetical protein
MNKLGQLILLALSSSLVTACVDAETPSGDDIDGTFLGGGKADGGISDGTADALGVLAVANTHSEDVLVLEVGLAPEAAAAIVDHRAAQRFETLAQLDDVPWVGSLAFERLLTYARANGFAVNAFDASSCAGPSIGLGALRALVGDDGILTGAPGLTWTRQRECDADGCGPWRAPELLADGESSLATTFATDEALSFTAGYLHTEQVDTADGPQQHRTSYTWEFDVSLAPQPELSAIAASYFLWMGPDVTADKALHETGVTFTDHCVRSVGRVFPELHNAPTIEQEIVFLARF